MAASAKQDHEGHAADKGEADAYITGTVLTFHDGRFVVKGTLPYSPAEKVGLKDDDLIVEVDGTSTEGLAWMDGLARLRSDHPSAAHVVILREGRRIGISLQRERLGDILARENLKVEDGQFVPIDEMPPLVIGQVAPSLQGIEYRSGKPFEGDRVRGHFIVVTFWTSWCAFCLDEVPFLEEARAKYAERILFVGVNLDDEADSMKNSLEKRPFADVQIHDDGWFGQTSRAYRAYRHGVPWIVLIGPDGRILADDLRGESMLARLASIQ